METINPLISVIIPVYKVQKYLEFCLNSVVSQTYINLEIILVDDGSPDGSGLICDEYARKDSRIKVIHQENGGLSCARNSGLDIMTGEFVLFVDSDDAIFPNSIQVLYELLIREKSDISVGYTVEAKSQSVKAKSKPETYKTFKKEEALKSYLYRKITPSAWNKLFRASLFDGLRFPVGRRYEDVVINYLLIGKSRLCSVCNQPTYIYNQHEGSIVRQKYSRSYMDYVYACRQLQSMVQEEYPGDISFSRAASSRLFWAEVHVLMHMDDEAVHGNDFTELWNEVKKNRKDILHDNQNSKLERMVALVSYGGYRMLKLAFSMKK